MINLAPFTFKQHQQFTFDPITRKDYIHSKVSCNINWKKRLAFNM